MRSLHRSSGFSLIELLTVIAIIAILAAIIFPVMGLVKERARQNHCMTNMKQIAIAVGMFKTDNRKYPEILGFRAYDANNNPIDRFENAKDVYLYPEYVKTVQIFHCPSSKFTNTQDTAEYDRIQDKDSTKVVVYAYDNYDCFVPLGAAGPPYQEPAVQPHYRTDWAPSADWMDGQLKPCPTTQTDTDKLRQQDYERQLKWRNPPETTVVTWCLSHATYTGGAWHGNAIAVFLDGHTELVDAGVAEACKWRMRPSP